MISGISEKADHVKFLKQVVSLPRYCDSLGGRVW